jgi:DNA end-binding protein Ku
MNMASQLIKSMTAPWNPEKYHDDYHESLEKVVKEKIQYGGKKLPAVKKARRPSNVIDLVSVLQQSIKETQGKSKGLKKAA